MSDELKFYIGLVIGFLITIPVNVWVIQWLQGTIGKRTESRYTPEREDGE